MTILPTVWLFVTSMTSGWQKIFHEKPSIGFLAQAKRFSAGIDSGTLIAPAKTIKDMETIVMNNYINAALCGFFMLVAVTMLISAFFVIRRALNANQPTVHETTPSLLEENHMADELDIKANMMIKSGLPWKGRRSQTWLSCVAYRCRWVSHTQRRRGSG